VNWAALFWLATIFGVLVVLTCEPDHRDQDVPAWSRATRHPQGIWTLAFTSDGRRLATGGDDGTVVVWEVGKRALSELTIDRPARVQCLAISPDGATLAAGYEGATVVLWNVGTGAKRVTFHGVPNQFLRLAFSPDGRLLASGGAQSNIRIWDVEMGRTTIDLLCHEGLVSALRFAPDGQTLASGYASGMVKLWDLTTGKSRELTGLNLPSNPILGLAFSHDGLMLAAGSTTHGTRLWIIATGLESAIFRNEDESVPEVAFSPSGQTLIELTRSRYIRLRDLATGRRRILFRCRGAYCSALTPDARFLATGDDGGIVKMWDLAQFD
jgi:WD40 repeat protein